jgi:hypothetical protein
MTGYENNRCSFRYSRKHIDALCGKSVEFVNVKAGDT